MTINRAEDNCTVGELARAVGLSRSTLLYYDRTRLLRPSGRSPSGYRLYTPADRERCERICFYRQMGIPLADIADMLKHDQAAGETGRILERRLRTLDATIHALQQQQRDILRLIKHLPSRGTSRIATDRARGSRHSPRARADGSRGSETRVVSQKENAVISKKRWVEIMAAAGFTEQHMQEWHKTFERMEPQGHQEFLESLSLADDEIARIRAWSQQS